MFESIVIVQVALFASAAAVTSLPTKFKIVIFAVPTLLPSLTVIPVISPAPVVLTGCSSIPDPVATGTSFALRLPLFVASFVM